MGPLLTWCDLVVVQLLYIQYNGHNFGHVIYDELLPWFTLLELFGRTGARTTVYCRVLQSAAVVSVCCRVLQWCLCAAVCCRVLPCDCILLR